MGFPIPNRPRGSYFGAKAFWEFLGGNWIVYMTNGLQQLGD